jgi:8-oxo-dGTP pyrophosphatase MutT (NUDIX family)
MQYEKQWLLETGMPHNLLREKRLFEPSSVGIIMHVGPLPYPRAREPKILLVRQHDQIEDGYHPWGIPAGHVEEGEAIEHAVRREMKEETGISMQKSRLQWFCPVGRGIVFTYELGKNELLHGRKKKLALDIEMFRPSRSVDRNEIDMMAFVPVETWMDHRLMVPNLAYPLAGGQHSVTDPASVHEDEALVAGMYKPEIWQAIRHQMFVRRIIPPYLG